MFVCYMYRFMGDLWCADLFSHGNAQMTWVNECVWMVPGTFNQE